MQNYISNLSNKSYKYQYFCSVVPKDLLTYFDGITEFSLSLNYVRKEDTKIRSKEMGTRDDEEKI